MQTYYYSFSHLLKKNRELFVLDADKEISFVLKQNRFFFTEIALFCSSFVKYTYRGESVNVKMTSYSILSRFGHYLRINDCKELIRIKNQRMQLLEKRQVFSIKQNDFSFEITATRVGILKKNGDIVAQSTITNLLKDEDHTITVEANNSDDALLCMVFFQTFHLAKYESRPMDY